MFHQTLCCIYKHIGRRPSAVTHHLTRHKWCFEACGLPERASGVPARPWGENIAAWEQHKAQNAILCLFSANQTTASSVFHLTLCCVYVHTGRRPSRHSVRVLTGVARVAAARVDATIRRRTFRYASVARCITGSCAYAQLLAVFSVSNRWHWAHAGNFM